MKLKKYFRKTSINKKYLEFCRLTQKYPIMAKAQLRWFWYCETMPDRFRHLVWYCNFAKKYGLYVDVKG
jgi:hypothetical protein